MAAPSAAAQPAARADEGPTQGAEQQQSEQDVADALRHFQRGVGLYEEQNYNAALVEFRRAYELAPNYRLLYNTGLAQRSLHSYAEASRSLMQYLQEGGTEIPAERIAEVRREIERLKGLTGYLTVHANVDGAQVFVDDQAVGRTPLQEAVVVDIGRHHVSVKAPGRRTTSAWAEVSAAERVQATLQMEPSLPAPVVVQSASKQEAPGPDATPVWISGGVTAALLVATTVTGLFTLQANSDLDDELAQVPVSEDDLQAARDRANRLALATDILGIATLVSAGVTTFLFFRWNGEKRAASGSAELGLGPGGVAFRGQF